MNDDKVKSKSLEDNGSEKYYEKISDVPLPDNSYNLPDGFPRYGFDDIPSFTIPSRKDNSTNANSTSNSTNTYTNKDINDLLKRLSVLTTKLYLYCNEYCFDDGKELNFFIIIQSENLIKLYVDVITRDMFKNLDRLTKEWTITSEQCEHNDELNLCINLYFLEEE